VQIDGCVDEGLDVIAAQRIATNRVVLVVGKRVVFVDARLSLVINVKTPRVLTPPN
jgi:hypothetical protein